MKKTRTIQKELSDELPKIPRIRTEKFRVAVISGIASLLVIVFSTLYLSGSTSQITQDVGIIFAILAGIIPLALLQLKEVQRRESIDRHLPLFLLSLVSFHPERL
ncbi:hypothetical protein QVH35_09775 [Candidatus Nitrosotenuis chungbukensis]|uniref:hypothetical protein n=1 Tax=Candidatus Nitrosotenuis chungbukensis TaxID=1353246 RepID=UPI002671E96A|nr:hypothetical protein [Candidatus Nitrosotenuis chungbukensis]WKT57623.1 hypothetical protein QVH35_09775 [Candidatus Nitrosotenuis chungbukensis]